MSLSCERKREIQAGYQAILAAINEAKSASPLHQDVTLVAASKTRSAEEINYAASLGLAVIGENRVQELCEKYDELDKNLDIHFIGALQTNKVKYIIDKVSLIHSVDRLSLAEEINRQASKHNKVMDVLCEINLGESQKSGIAPEQLPEFLEKIAPLCHIRVRGLMAVPPICTNYEEQFAISQKFINFFIDNSTKNIDNRCSMQICSFGMSNDFRAAIAAGSNMVRLGSALFGARDYTTSH